MMVLNGRAGGALMAARDLLRAAAVVGKVDPLACTTLKPRCAVDIGHTASQGVVDGALSGVAAAIRDGIAWVVKNTVSWWVNVPSRELDHETAVVALRSWTLPVAVVVGVLGMLATAARISLSRKATPLIDAGSGLITVAAASALGIVVPALLLRAGDAWSNWILNASTGHRFAARVTDLLTFPGAPAGVVVVLGIVGLFAAALQAVLMLFRETALIILAGVLPLAAAGTLTPVTRAWFAKVSGWMLALIFYKPVAAMVYATAFTLVGTGKDVRTVFLGFATMILSLIALPTLMKLFDWTTGTVGTTDHGGGLMGAAVGGVAAVGAFRGGVGGFGAQPDSGPGAGAAGQARFLSQQLGGTATGARGGGRAWGGGSGSGGGGGGDGGGNGSGGSGGGGGTDPGGGGGSGSGSGGGGGFGGGGAGGGGGVSAVGGGSGSAGGGSGGGGSGGVSGSAAGLASGAHPHPSGARPAGPGPAGGGPGAAVSAGTPTGAARPAAPAPPNTPAPSHTAAGSVAGASPAGGAATGPPVTDGPAGAGIAGPTTGATNAADLASGALRPPREEQ